MNEKANITSQGELIIYQTEDGATKLNVQLKDESVWLSLDQMAALFQRDKSVISRHLKNLFEEGELTSQEVVAFFATTTSHGAIRGLTQTIVLCQ